MEQYPLQWPTGWKRTPRPKRSVFKRKKTGTYGWDEVSIADATNELLGELKLFLKLNRISQNDVIISTNLKYKNDGFPYSNQKQPDDKGVAVYFKYNGEDVVFANDSYDRIADNIYAISLTVGAMRTIERHGSSELISKAFTGFKALPEQGSGEAWWSILNVTPNASENHIKEAFRSLAKVYHPDNIDTGNAERFIVIQRAYDHALKQIKK